ncbi:hypothetical protein FACHB389_30170 [Nostoc calcicola FACHB-389]|nr:hypothetical protein [Nostoc calcicola FACHB-3891]OKH23879.1 hypothetical protein FACHB389_30170 [Nostoc calcicola FACHB-389]
MQKPLTYDRSGFANEKLSSILTQTLPKNKLFLSIYAHQLTKVIETLESIGITDDTAIFILACLQGGVV